MINTTKEMIARTSLMLVQKKSLQKISVSEIVSAAGISRGTFYHHFVDMQDLINWIFHQEVSVPFREAIRSADETPSDLSLLFLKALYRNRTFYCQAFRMEGPGTLYNYARTEILENWTLYFDRLTAKNHVNDAASLEQMKQLIEMVALGSFNSLVEWAREGMLTPPEQLSHTMDQQVLPLLAKFMPAAD